MSLKNEAGFIGIYTKIYIVYPLNKMTGFVEQV